MLDSNLFDALLLLTDILGHEETLERSPEHMLAQNTECDRVVHTLAINFATLSDACSIKSTTLSRPLRIASLSVSV